MKKLWAANTSMSVTPDVYQVKKSFYGDDVRAYLFIVANPDKGIAEDDPFIDVCVGVNAFFPITMGY